MPLLFRAKQCDDRRHQQNNGQEGDDEPREHVDAFLGIQPHELVRCAGAVAGGNEQALSNSVSTIYAQSQPSITEEVLWKMVW